MSDHNGGTVIPLIEERARLSKQPRITGRVRVSTRIERRREELAADLMRTDADVERVPVGREVSEVPPVRREGDVIVVPVVEEEAVVVKRLILKEEIRIVRRETVVRTAVPVELKTMRADIERTGDEGESE